MGNISDVTGRIVTTKKVSLAEGLNKFQIDASTFSKGVYFVEVSNNVTRTVQRLILDK